MTPDRLDQLIATAARLWNTTPDHIRGRPGTRPSRQPNAVHARQALAYVLQLHWTQSSRQAAQALHISHPTALRSLTNTNTNDPRLRDLEQEALWPNP